MTARPYRRRNRSALTTISNREGRRIEMVNSCIMNKARQMFILTFLHTKGDDLTVAPIRP